MDTLLSVMSIIQDGLDFLGDDLRYEKGVAMIVIKTIALLLVLLFTFCAKRGYHLVKLTYAVMYGLTMFAVSAIYLALNKNWSAAPTLIVSAILAILLGLLIYGIFEKILGILFFIPIELIFIILFVSISKAEKTFALVICVILATIISLLLTCLIIKFTKPVLIIVTAIVYGCMAGAFFGILFNLPDLLTDISKALFVFHGAFHQVMLYGFITGDKETVKSEYNAHDAYEKILQLSRDENVVKDANGASDKGGENPDPSSKSQTEPNPIPDKPNPPVDKVTAWVRETYDDYFQKLQRFKIECRKFKWNLKSQNQTYNTPQPDGNVNRPEAQPAMAVAQEPRNIVNTEAGTGNTKAALGRTEWIFIIATAVACIIFLIILISTLSKRTTQDSSFDTEPEKYSYSDSYTDNNFFNFFTDDEYSDDYYYVDDGYEVPCLNSIE